MFTNFVKIIQKRFEDLRPGPGSFCVALPGAGFSGSFPNWLDSGSQIPILLSGPEGSTPKELALDGLKSFAHPYFVFSGEVYSGDDEKEESPA